MLDRLLRPFRNRRTAREQDGAVHEPSEICAPFTDPVVLPLEDVLDLHPFAPRDIDHVVPEYLDECRKAGLMTVRLIHGKGKGVRRERVRALLSQLPWVEGFRDAPIEAGGWGATLVTLRPEGADPLPAN